MIAILIAEGFEEIEALTPLDILRRAGAEVKTVGIGNKRVTGAHGITITCDLSDDEADITTFEAVILPGGMPGTLNLDASPFVDCAVRYVNEKGGRIGAICAGPIVLGRRGLLKDRYAVCYPGFEEELGCKAIPDTPVATYGNITTSRGLGTALDFALELVRLLCENEVAKEVSRAVIDKDNATRGDTRYDYTGK